METENVRKFPLTDEEINEIIRQHVDTDQFTGSERSRELCTSLLVNDIRKTINEEFISKVTNIPTRENAEVEIHIIASMLLKMLDFHVPSISNNEATRINYDQLRKFESDGIIPFSTSTLLTADGRKSIESNLIMNTLDRLFDAGNRVFTDITFIRFFYSKPDYDPTKPERKVFQEMLLRFALNLPNICIIKKGGKDGDVEVSVGSLVQFRITAAKVNGVMIKEAYVIDGHTPIYKRDLKKVELWRLQLPPNAKKNRKNLLANGYVLTSVLTGESLEIDDVLNELGTERSNYSEVQKVRQAITSVIDYQTKEYNGGCEDETDTPRKRGRKRITTFNISTIEQLEQEQKGD